MTGSSQRKIVFYCRKGVVPPPAPDNPEEWEFTEEAVFRVRHIEFLRQHHRMNWAAIEMIMALHQEVETLRSELRSQR